MKDLPNKTIQMTWLEKNWLICKRDKERRSNYFCLNFFLPIFPLLFSILKNILIIDSLIGIKKGFVSRFFRMFRFYTPWIYESNHWFFYVFREYKRLTLGRNKSSFLTHFSATFLFYTPCKRQKTLGLLLFPGGIKSEHWEVISWNYKLLYVNIYTI